MKSVALSLAACLGVALAACGGASPKASSGMTTTSGPSTSAAAPTTAAGRSTSTAAVQTVPPTTAAGVDGAIGAYGDCTSPTVEPAEIVLTCADYGELLEGLHWTSWTASSATAVGTLLYNDCLPDCAGGKHHSVPNTAVTLTVPVQGAGGMLVWSEVQENPEPPGYETGPYHGGPQPLPIRPD